MARCKRVRSNVLQQDVYVSEARGAVDVPHPHVGDLYVTERIVPVPGFGERHLMVDTPYPYTQDAVNSFAPSCDYRADPVAAAAAPSRGNIGDVAAIQEALAMDSSAVRDIIARVIAAQQAQAQAQSQTAASTTTEGGEENA